MIIQIFGDDYYLLSENDWDVLVCQQNCLWVNQINIFFFTSYSSFFEINATTYTEKSTNITYYFFIFVNAVYMLGEYENGSGVILLHR